YQLVREECYPMGKALNPALAVLSVLSCFESDDEAIDKRIEGAQFFAYSLGYYYNPFTGGSHQPGKMNIYKQFMDTPPDQRWGPLGEGFRGFGGLQGASITTELKDKVTRSRRGAGVRGRLVGSL